MTTIDNTVEYEIPVVDLLSPEYGPLDYIKAARIDLASGLYADYTPSQLDQLLDNIQMAYAGFTSHQRDWYNDEVEELVKRLVLLQSKASNTSPAGSSSFSASCVQTNRK